MTNVKFFFLVTFLVSFIDSRGQVAFGPKAGVNLSTFNLKDADETYDSRTGFHAGFFLRTRFDKVALQPELLLFTQKGNLKSSVFGTAQESFTYISVPVMLKFYPVGGLNVQLGPQFGFLVDGERKYNTVFGSTTEDIKDHYKNTDVSISVGGGYDFGFGLNLDLRYNLGIMDVNNASSGDPIKSRVFLVSLGWNFLGK